MIKTVLSFFNNNQISAIVRGALNIRASYNVYERCYEYWKLHERELDPHFSSGVELGVGCFNLFTSLLPPIYLKLVELIGFSGNRKLGFELLEKGSESTGIRSVFCSLALLLYHAMLGPINQFNDVNYPLAERICNQYLKKYPECIIFLFYRARLYNFSGSPAKAIEIYRKSTKHEFNGMWERVSEQRRWMLSVLLSFFLMKASSYLLLGNDLVVYCSFRFRFSIAICEPLTTK